MSLVVDAAQMVYSMGNQLCQDGYVWGCKAIHISGPMDTQCNIHMKYLNILDKYFSVALFKGIALGHVHCPAIQL